MDEDNNLETLSGEAVSSVMKLLDQPFRDASDLAGYGGIFHVNMRVMQTLLYGAGMILHKDRIQHDDTIGEPEKIMAGGHAPSYLEDTTFTALLLAALNDVANGPDALGRALLWYRKIRGRDYEGAEKYSKDAFGEPGAAKH